MTNIKKNIAREKRVRLHLRAIGDRPRLSVYRSNAHIIASVIDDLKHITVATVTDKGLKGTKTEKSTQVGELVAAASKKAGVNKVAFDRGSHRYHGRVKALAEGARAKGLEF